MAAYENLTTKVNEMWLSPSRRLHTQVNEQVANILVIVQWGDDVFEGREAYRMQYSVYEVAGKVCVEVGFPSNDILDRKSSKTYNRMNLGFFPWVSNQDLMEKVKDYLNNIPEFKPGNNYKT